MDIIDVLTQRLRDLMEEHRIRAAPLARRAQLNESAVRDILRGRSKNPGIVTLQKIAGVMNLRPSALFESGQKWPVIGEIDSDGKIRRLDQAGSAQEYLENPFLTFLDEPLSAIKACSAATAPLAYDGDYLVISPFTEEFDDSILGRPAVCELGDGVEMIAIPQVSSSADAYHLAAINAFSAGRRDATLRRVAPILLTLPARLALSEIPATHAGPLTVQEKKSSYAAPRTK